MKTGLACGGPADGKMLSAEVSRIGVPILIPGEAGIGISFYAWRVCVWVHEG